jgi:hypothetical protein
MRAHLTSIRESLSKRKQAQIVGHLMQTQAACQWTRQQFPNANDLQMHWCPIDEVSSRKCAAKASAFIMFQ